ncbi:MAG: outer membrane protein assembly factor BamD [Campylobacterota bacterium]|nr:outer membrane protein assembly factor BamD [Campylobacterota bacterium]
MIRKILLMAFALLIVTGCSVDTTKKEFNKTALSWYTKITNAISSNNLDKADEYYLSMRSEHTRSTLLQTTTMMLAHAHMDKEEYLMARYYFDEYNKRFALGDRKEYAEFMKLKAAFLGIRDTNKDQKLMMDTITNANKFLYTHPFSQYKPLVNTIIVRLKMSQILLNENVASLYNRVGKDDAAKIYRAKNQTSSINMSDISKPDDGILNNVTKVFK